MLYQQNLVICMMASFNSFRVQLSLTVFIVQIYYNLVIAIETSTGTKSIHQNDLEALRLQAKPWYMKNISFGNMQIPISPATLIVSFLTLFYMMYYYYSTQCFCVASHILVKDIGKETKQKLEQWKEKIGSNSHLFAKYATDHSECPSGKHNGGHLGKFYMYDMAPNFNAVCFDNKTPLQTAVGPIQTQFGYHLIYIHERQMPK